MFLNNRYLVAKELSSGGFGKTYLAQDTQVPSRRLCVIKQLIYPARSPQEEALIKDRFFKEAAALEKLGESHDQIPKLYAYIAEGDNLFLIQEWVDGETLESVLGRKQKLSEPEVIDFLLELLPVLEYVHAARNVHRDIKPGNIILRKSDNKPVLIDFGLVKESAQTVLGEASSFSIIAGTEDYMPAEQRAGKPVFSSDIYSLGITAIRMLTGKRKQDLYDLTTGEFSLSDYTADISPELAGVLEKAVEENFRDRYLTAKEMRKAVIAARDAKTERITEVIKKTIVEPLPDNLQPEHTAVEVAKAIIVAPSRITEEKKPDQAELTFKEFKKHISEYVEKKFLSFITPIWENPLTRAPLIFAIFWLLLAIGYPVNLLTIKLWNMVPQDYRSLGPGPYPGINPGWEEMIALGTSGSLYTIGLCLPLFVFNFKPFAAYLNGALGGLMFYFGNKYFVYYHLTHNPDYPMSVSWYWPASLEKIIRESWSRGTGLLGYSERNEYLFCILVGMFLVGLLKMCKIMILVKSGHKQLK